MRRCVSSSPAGSVSALFLSALLLPLSGCIVREAIACESSDECPTDAICQRAVGQSRGLCTKGVAGEMGLDLDALNALDLAPSECAPAASPMTHSDCPLERPICDPSGSCRICTLHADCPSQVCRIDGTCGAESQTVYVDRDQACNGADGSLTKPHCQISTALANLAGHTLVRVRGAAAAYDPIAVTTPIEVLGPDGDSAVEAVVQGGQVPAISVEGVAGAVTLSGLRLAGTSAAQPNLRCTGTTALQLRRMILADAAGVGLMSSGCALTVVSLQILGNQQGGIRAEGASVSLESTILSGNLGPAIELDTAAPVSLRFLTLANNQVPIAAGRAGAVHNRRAGVTVELDASIVWNNSLLADSPLYGATGTNLVANLNLPGAVKSPPDFRSANDFHLAGRTSNNLACCIDKRLSGPALDVDAQTRPFGAAFEIGADEIP